MELPTLYSYPLKRRRVEPASHYLPLYQAPVAEDIDDEQEPEDIWEDKCLFALDTPPPGFLPAAADLDGQGWPAGWSPPTQLRKRNATQFVSDNSFGDGAWDDSTNTQPNAQRLRHEIPEMFPTSPSLEERFVNLNLANPFAEGVQTRHPRIKESASLPEDGGVNGYIKFRLRMSDVEGEATQKRSIFDRRDDLGRKVQLQTVSYPGAPQDHIPNLPPDFGRGLKLDPTDLKLLKFFTVAYCQGRTLLNKTNFWLLNIAPMATSDICVKHAVLAIAGAYVLDYLPSPELLKRTNDHWAKAVKGIDDALVKPETHGVGKGDSVIAAILILLAEDSIFYELRKSGDSVPNWHSGGILARTLLDNSDLNYRYWKTKNVQYDSARLANINWAAFTCILAEPVRPLEVEKEGRHYNWLLAGNQAEIRKIHGSTGLSPSLLHMFSQVTHLSALLQETPDNDVIPEGAELIRKRLINFRQLSELSLGHRTPEDLFRSCVLVDGKVTTSREVTELTGEVWVCCTQMYLEARFFRKPRYHVDVQKPLKRLLACLKRMPYEGPLFTSQAPFAAIVLAALVSVRQEERGIIREWFDVICSGAGGRCSVPPVWEIVQDMWVWFDDELVDVPLDEVVLVGERFAWWEAMVARIVEKHGWVSLM